MMTLIPSGMADNERYEIESFSHMVDKTKIVTGQDIQEYNCQGKKDFFNRYFLKGISFRGDK